MCGGGMCPKCGGERRVVRGMLLRDADGAPAGTLDPASALKVNAFVCTRCGHTEMYAHIEMLRTSS